MEENSIQGEPMSSAPPRTGISIMMFIGVKLRPDLKMLLHNSPAWRRAKAVSDEGDLKEQSYQGNTYLGLLISSDTIPFSEISSLEHSIRSRLKHYCEELDIDALPVEVFPQTFIA